MCGIVGIIGNAPVADRLVQALKRLEYRGYDSAGVATVHNSVLDRRRAPGKLNNLEKALSVNPLQGNTGIGHTRWATHGAPTESNAHPHATPKVSVVHNGIIENYRDLREQLANDGYKAQTETDSEIVALLTTREIDNGASPTLAVANTLKMLRGAFGLAFLFDGHDKTIIAARQGSPLAIGFGENEMYLGSDAFALAPFTNKITYLEEGDWAVLNQNSVTIFDSGGERVDRDVQVSAASASIVDKGNHRHFMAKEIYEQPESIARALGHYLDLTTGTAALPADVPFDFSDLSRITIASCGGSFLAASVAKYWFEKYAKLPVDVDIASEFRYREPPLEKNGLSLFISQSGETADTLAALRYSASQNQHIASIVNVAESTIARESDIVFPILCGPEIAVASTKALTAQLTVLACLVVAAGRKRGVLSEEKEQELVKALLHLPSAVTQALRNEANIEAIAKKLSRASDVLYLGRGPMFPIALEGALKLKEISYIHAEGYAAGE
ncbi:MAG: glutamine--fructose-6-phosphate transaminase (isomerizing), partial [Devosiaceae bacterium]|nr:glutamine--fructose-6-phosphate transaminase (isomerizing) [Devosiaceae bacterium]